MPNLFYYCPIKNLFLSSGPEMVPGIIGQPYRTLRWSTLASELENGYACSMLVILAAEIM